MSTRILTFLILLIILCAPRTHAHPMLVRQGTITWIDDTLAIEFDAHALTIDDPHSLLDAFVLLNENGDAAAPLDATLEGNSETARVAYSIEGDTLALRLDPHTTISRHRMQLQLLRHDLSGGSSTHRLTTGANTIVLTRSSHNQPARSSSHMPSISTHANNGAIAIEVRVPARLLSHWTRFHDALRGDLIDPDFVDTHASDLRQWLRQNLTIESHGHTHAQPSDITLSLRTTSGRSPVRTSAIDLTHVIWTSSITPDCECESLTLRWNGFSPSVRRAHLRAQSSARWRPLNPTQDSWEVSITSRPESRE
ncbi:MAG: hypothetical protein ACF8GE_04990 [Phycisphaerales bacterium JB043]